MWNPYCNNHYAKFERVTVYYPKSCCNVRPTPPISTTTTTSSSTTTTTSTSSTTTTTTTCNPSCINDWATTNLAVTKYANGDDITYAATAGDWATANGTSAGAYCCPNGDCGLVAEYGYIYNGFAVSDPRGLAPLGYHVATPTEWVSIGDCLGGASVAGGKLKEAGTSHWQSPNIAATNCINFTALPGGYRFPNGSFFLFGQNGFWWSSTGNTYYSMSYLSGAIDTQFYSSGGGFSVRVKLN